jgi:carboxymethylenebutenolidase
MLALAACRSAPPPHPPPPVTPARVAAPGPTEEEFAAMEERFGDAPYAPRGESVGVAGSRAYLSLPAGAPPFPGVVVIHDGRGLDDLVRFWSDRLAANGYAALVVDLFGRSTTDPDEATRLESAVDPAAAVRVLLAAHEFLRSDTRVHAPRRAALGWGWGGGMALELAMAAPDLDAAIAYYAPPVTDVTKLGRIRARMLGVYATRDETIPPDAADAFARAAGDARVRLELLRYDAAHGFANRADPRYDRDAAADAWQRIRAFLAETLRR